MTSQTSIPKKKAEALKITGYADRFSVQTGERIRFMVSSEFPRYRADIVRLIHGDDNPKGPGFKFEAVETQVAREYEGRKQSFRRGSYVVVTDSPALRGLTSFTLQAWILPTTPQKGLQGLLTSWSSEPDVGASYGLFISESGESVFRIRSQDGTVSSLSSEKKLHPFRWYFIAASYDARSGGMLLYQEPVTRSHGEDDPDSSTKKSIIPSSHRNTGPFERRLLIAAFWNREAAGTVEPGGHYNGKIDGAKIFRRALNVNELRVLNRSAVVPARLRRHILAAWDFARDPHSTTIRDSSRNRIDGRSVNFPTRAVTGHNWSGTEGHFTYAAEEYQAVYFHDDDLGDARWKVDFELKVPKEMKSGVYAAHLQSGSSEDYIPFFVRPKKGKPTAKIVFLAPTLSYMAYGDEQMLASPDNRILQNVGDDFPYPSQPQDAYTVENGLLSLYDHHSDGSGVCHSSRRRPLVNMRPKYRMPALAEGRGAPHQFNADLHLLDWMEVKGYEFDVITDEDLHHEGLDLLRPYNVIVTGSHPEYWSWQMLTALEAYVDDGGRLMYLGGNGFYWVTTINPESPYIIEVRRWAGTGDWHAKAGEFYNSTTGELGGLWRYRGMAPQKLVGVGFTSQGFDRNQPYRRQPDSFDERASFIFEGIGKTELIGNFESLVQSFGAAGFEVDRLDYALGTPPYTLLLASATGFSDSYQHCIEEETQITGKQGGKNHPLIRADMVYLDQPNGGDVFSVGSIAWCASLSYNNYDNNVSRVTENVLRRFASGSRGSRKLSNPRER